MEYLFGDTDVAARRLKVLAEVYAESSRAFLLEAVNGAPNFVIDLGCGPGYTTHFLADALGCGHAAGLDSSGHFISVARKTETGRVSFHLHDVTSVPFLVGPGDLLYCRLLLTHLREYEALLVRWATQLQPGGLLLIEEVKSIQTENSVFASYIKIVEALLKHQGNSLYAGKSLDRLKDTPILSRRASRVKRLPVENNRAAAMFSLNIRSWKEHPFVRSNYPCAVIDRLVRALDQMAQEPTGATDIEWGMRQMVYEQVRK